MHLKCEEVLQISNTICNFWQPKW